jgi:hypothetical protein
MYIGEIRILVVNEVLAYMFVTSVVAGNHWDVMALQKILLLKL